MVRSQIFGFVVDRRVEGGEEPFGFVEATTAMHKTSTSAERKRRHMPLVCPILGVTGLDWTVSWLSAAVKLGLDPVNVAVGESFGALCRALDGNGCPCKRSCTSSEITEFLNVFFSADSSNRVSSHSLKETTLAWASRFGIDEDARTLLGQCMFINCHCLCN